MEELPKKLTLSNLTISQWNLAESLLKSDNHIVVEADKNLGGCIMDRETYIMKGIQEHLGNKEVYQQLTKLKAEKKIHIVRYKISLFLSKYKDDLCPAERKYLHDGLLKYKDKFPKFRMSAKVHKTPWKLRPIVCCAGISQSMKWDQYYQDTVTTCSYTRDS